MGVAQLRGVWRSEYAFASVEVDVNDILASKIGALQLGVAIGTSHHGTAVHVHKYGQVLALGRRPDVEIQAILALPTIPSTVTNGLRACRPIGHGLEYRL